MIVQDLSQLPNLTHERVRIVDIESTNFNDTKDGLCPFRGGRIAGIGLSVEDGSQTWYLPVRHHCVEGDLLHNLPVEAVMQYMRDLFTPETVFANHHAKFDGRFFAVEGVRIRSRIECTQVLGRLVDEQRDKRFGGTGYGLDAMALDWVHERKSGSYAKEYLKSVGTKDFGRLPIAVCGSYCEQDVRITARLRLALLRALPACSKEIWEIEQRCTAMFLRNEVRGIPLNMERLNSDYLLAMEKLLPMLEEIKRVAGWEVNVGSNAQLTKLMSQLGVTPTMWTAAREAKYDEEGNEVRTAREAQPSWTSLGLDTLVMPPSIDPKFGTIIAAASRLSHFISNYCEGWKNAAGEDGRLHPHFNQWGTITGRLSTTDPNAQNPDDVAESWIEPCDMQGIPDRERVLVYRDYSQLEYRIFGHYTQAPLIVDKYAADVDTDFHQFLADMLGTPRQFAKTLNFSFIYGMGKKKLLKSLSAVLAMALRKGDETVNAKLHALLMSSQALQKQAHLLTSVETEAVAARLYDKYHALLPEIRKFQKLVESCCRSRGWIKNFFGRVYRLSPKLAYRGVNYIVQGSGGDYTKERVCAVDEQLGEKYNVHLYTLVHDSMLHSVPRECAYDFFRESLPLIEESRFKIPMRAATKVSAASWSQVVKISRDCPELDFDAALAKSLVTLPMSWDIREQRKYEGTSEKGHGV